MKNEVERELFVLGLDDWFPFTTVPAICQELGHYKTKAELAEAALQTILALLERGDFRAGEISLQTNGFVPWNLSPAQAVARMRREWNALGQELSFGDICWFEITEHGEQAARAKGIGA